MRVSESPPNIRVRRHPERGHHDRDILYSIIDGAWYCHAATVRDGWPVVIPTLHIRIGGQLYIHGAVAAGLLKNLGEGAPVCVTVTHLDGLVLARSLYNHSANYRSAVVFGQAREVTDPAEKMAVFRAFADRVAPGRWDDARQPNDREVRTTRVFAIPLENASAKIRQGPPADDPEDMDRPTWAGVLPLRTVYGDPEPDPAQSPAAALPGYLKDILDRDRIG